jgi:ribosomal protein S12 methylthiotransferase accessory factor
MEAIERVSAETIAGERQRVASYRDLESALGAAVLDPAEFDLPFESTYAPDTPISWVSGWDLLSQERVWVAADLAISPAIEGVCLGAETNGLASGNTYTEATVHALYEVIERDAVACADYREMWGRSDDLRLAPLTIIDPATLTGGSAAWHETLRALGLHLQIREFTVDTAVPVFGVRLVDPCFPGGAREFHGYGASLEPGRAVIRAVTEAVQTHTAYFLGSRDGYESGPHVGDQRLLESRMWLDSPVQPWPHRTSGPVVPDGDLLTELYRLVDCLRACGFRRCVVVDLMNAHLSVPVVRVLVPGLAYAYGMSRRRPPVRLLRQLV